MSNFCAYCFGPLGPDSRPTMNGRYYHPGCIGKDKAIGKPALSTAEGVKVGGRGAEWLEKHGVP